MTRRPWAACAWMAPLLRSVTDTQASTCVRKYDDAAIRRIVDATIVERALKVDRPYRIDVNWSDCRYFVTIWRTDPPPPPDSELLLTLDESDSIIERPTP